MARGYYTGFLKPYETKTGNRPVNDYFHQSLLKAMNTIPEGFGGPSIKKFYSFVNNSRQGEVEFFNLLKSKYNSKEYFNELGNLSIPGEIILQELCDAGFSERLTNYGLETFDKLYLASRDYTYINQLEGTSL